jgi:hypothetical protein
MEGRAMKTLALAIMVGVAAEALAAPAVALISSGSIEPAPPESLATTPPPESHRREELAPIRAQQKPTLSPNPLWTIPLTVLNETRDRPIFSPSRRPIQMAPPAPVVQAAPAIATSTEHERPQLTLLGTIVNETDGFGLFLDQATRTPFQLRLGASHQGWILNSVSAGSVILERGGDSAVFVVSKTNATAGNTSEGARASVSVVPLGLDAIGPTSFARTVPSGLLQNSDGDHRPVRRSTRVFQADD